MVGLRSNVGWYNLAKRAQLRAATGGPPSAHSASYDVPSEGGMCIVV